MFGSLKSMTPQPARIFPRSALHALRKATWADVRQFPLQRLGYANATLIDLESGPQLFLSTLAKISNPKNPPPTALPLRPTRLSGSVESA